MDAEKQRIVVFEGNDVVAVLTIAAVEDGIARSVLEAPDNINYMGLATLLLLAYAHVVDNQPAAVPPGLMAITEEVIAVFDPQKEDFPF